jgi:hypothetical protein
MAENITAQLRQFSLQELCIVLLYRGSDLQSLIEREIMSRELSDDDYTYLISDRAIRFETSRDFYTWLINRMEVDPIGES